MELRLDGKVALVTGASRGIGRAIATEMAASGARVMISSRKQEALDEAAGTMEGDVATFVANAGEPDQAAACVAACAERFGGLDILVNNAATNPYGGPIMGIDLPRYDKTWQVNLRGPLVWTQEAYRVALAETGGTVINIASVGGYAIEHQIGVYNTTKAALIYLTRALASELAPTVRVNAIAPGLVKTDMARGLWEPAEEQIARSMPLGRLGDPTDIANAALFLASDAASWITGHTLVVDGGLLVRRLIAPAAAGRQTYDRRMRISERWEYLTIDDVPDDQIEWLKESYAELGYHETERGDGRLIVRKEFPVTGQILVD